MECVIFDIDGTLAECRHRLHFVTDGVKDWAGFFSMLEDDPTHEPIAKLLRFLHGQIAIIITTGRPANYLEGTERWLARHNLPYAKLYMRAKGDYRQDATIKREILAQIRADGFEPMLVVDDRQQVVDMWREEGLVCLQADPGSS